MKEEWRTRKNIGEKEAEGKKDDLLRVSHAGTYTKHMLFYMSLWQIKSFYF